MAVKRKAPTPPPPQADSSEEYSSSDDEEEQVVAPVISSQEKTPQRTVIPSQAKTPQRTEVDDDDESETDSGSDSEPEPDPPANPVVVRQKPSEFEESSDEEDEEEEQPKVEKPKSPPRKAESEPEKKKPKLSASSAARIWSNEDEMVLLRALSEYHAKTGKLPPFKDYASFLATISRSIGFPVTEKQLSNKIRMMKQNYSKKKEKGTDAKFSNSHDKAVFDMSSKLFNDTIKVSKKKVKLESNSDADTEDGGVAGVANGGVTHNGGALGDASARSNFYFRSFIEDMIKEQQIPSWLMVEDVVAQIGESRAQEMNAKIKVLRIDAIKLRAREENMKAELFATLGEMIGGD